MRVRSRSVLVLAMLAGAATAGAARADIYTWVDASGRTNISNVAPPEGVTVKSVVTTPPKDPMMEAAARESARQEILALKDRVAQLEAENARSRQNFAPPPAYFPPPAPYPTQQGTPIEVTVMGSEPSYSGCDYSWYGCGFWPGFAYYAPPFYTTTSFFPRAKRFQRSYVPAHGSSPGMRPPGNVPGVRPPPRPQPIAGGGQLAVRSPSAVPGAYPKR